MKLIPLTQGYETIVDDADYPALQVYSWCYKRCGTLQYAARGTKNNGLQKTILMHRAILNAPDGIEVDHINGNGLDNRRCNLRLVSSSQNHFNQRKQQRQTSSQYKGVYWHQRDKVWMARIQAFGSDHYIGSFRSEREAALAYNKAAIKFHGEYAKLNQL